MSYGPPINYGTLLDGFETTTGWTKTTDSTLAANTTNFREGTQSLRLTGTTAGTNEDAVKTLAGSPIDMSAFKTFSIDVYCHSDPQTTIATVTVYFDTGSSANAFSASYAGTQLVLGWNRLVFSPADFTAIGAADWATIQRVRVRLFAAPAQTVDASFDNLRHDYYGKPCVLICFDDIADTAVTEGVSYMQTKGLAGTLFVDHDLIGTAGEATLAQIATGAAAGFLIGNHGYSHIDPNTQTADQVETNFRRNADYLESLGYVRGSRHATTPTAITASATTLQGLAAAGMVTCGQSATRIITRPVDDYLSLGNGAILNTTTLAAAKAMVDRAIAVGQTQILRFHKLVAAPSESTEWAISDFQALVDYVAAYALAGTLVCTTIDRWFSAGAGPSLVWNGTGWA